MEAFTTPGAFSWNELMTTDPAAAAKFYGALFGWNVLAPNEQMGDYRMINVGETGIGGISAIPPDRPGMPPNWGSYVTVANTDQTAAKCESLGGKVLMAPMDIPGVGRMAVLMDPQGAVINVIAYVPM